MGPNTNMIVGEKAVLQQQQKIENNFPRNWYFGTILPNGVKVKQAVTWLL